jgi:hypothetical protein
MSTYGSLKRVHASEHDKEPLPQWLNSWGTYNTMPEPWVEISHDQFWHQNIYVHHAEEFRQVVLDRYSKDHPDRERIAGLAGPLGMVELKIQWGHDGAFAIVRPRFRSATKDERAANGGCACHFEQPRYLRIGCQHDDVRTRNVGNCLNEYRCTKCGRVHVVDSSG